MYNIIHIEMSQYKKFDKSNSSAKEEIVAINMTEKYLL